MATKVHMEALSPTMEEGQLVKWLKHEGDAVNEGDVLAEIETDKATMELVARGSGVLQGITIKEGDTAPVGQQIATIAAAGEAAATPAADAPAAPAGAADAKPTAPAKDTGRPADTTGISDKAAAGAGDAGGSAEAVATTGQTEKPRSEQTNRTPAAEGTGAPATAPAPASTVTSSKAQGASNEDADADGDSGRLRASPLARRLAGDAGLDLSGVEGTGPGGRITKKDIEAALQAGPKAASQTAAGSSAAASTPGASGTAAAEKPRISAARVAGGPESEDFPVTQMRKTIAKRLVTSIGPVPTFYLTRDIDMTRVVDARQRINARLEKQGVKVSVNDIIIKAVGAALIQHPEVNAAWGDNVITRHYRAHIGVAVAVEDGLITPIIRDADSKPVSAIASEVRELAGRAREKKLKPEEYTGATFSISNLGMFGIEEFTAIINPPESAILAVGAVEDRVVVVDGEAVIRARMRITLSCDHRVIDGATGARFLETLAGYLEEPLMILV
jgi:pyruvate dehydrogenase E2 component (dihydrolipoamide acetyltransferase)